jgi:transcriptional regulator with XRE-family HTH domain
MNLKDRAFLQDLGYRLRELRLARGLTQAELAEKCDLHRTFIGSVERGERNLSVLNLRRIAGVLRVPLAELFAEAQGERHGR